MMSSGVTEGSLCDGVASTSNWVEPIEITDLRHQRIKLLTKAYLDK